MSDSHCPECKKITVVITDHSAGDSICSECGLVLEAHQIDETSEWRNFSDSTGGQDPNRVGDPTNPLLGDAALHTAFTKTNGSSGDILSSSMNRWQNRGSSSDQALIQAFSVIAVMCDRLGLVASIKDRANEICKRVEDLKTLKGRSQDAVLAACIYIACRQEDKPRTVKEICSVANGATRKEIGRAKEFIVKLLESDMGKSVEMGTISAGDFLKRFCSHLGLTRQMVRAAEETVKNCEALDIRRSPISVAAAIIYMITELSSDKKHLRDIADATGVGEGTIRNTYKEDLYPHAPTLVPSWYLRDQQQLGILTNPFDTY